MSERLSFGWRWRASLALVALLVAGACGGGPASGQSAAAFYKGKTLTLIVPYGPGGGYDRWARMAAPIFQKQLGVAKVDVVNAPGGGGLVGAGKIYAAKPDGLTIGDVNAGGDVFAQLFDLPGRSFDMSKFSWIGRPDNETQIMVLLDSGPYHSFADLLKAKAAGTKVPVVTTGAGSNEYYGAVITMNALGIPFKLLTGYKGSSDAKAGLIRGDGDVAEFSYDTLIAFIDSKKVTPVLQQRSSRWSVLKDLPTAAELGQQEGAPASSVDALKAMAGILALGHAFAGPPGIPADRLAMLQNAFKAAVNDPAFQAEAKKAKSHIEYGSPSDLASIVSNGLKQKQTFASLVKTQ